MGIWYLNNGGRLALERSEIEALQTKASWLLGIDWDIEGRRLVVKASIEAHGHVYSVKLTYPDFFPATPPFVTPVDAEERWSAHQYASGTLCLEWGPDNWHPDVTGAQLLESTFRLLETENPLGTSKEHGVVASRHYLTPGQTLRNEIFRIHLANPIIDYLSKVGEKKIGYATLTYVIDAGAIVYHLLQVNENTNEQLPEPFIKSNLKEQYLLYRSTATPDQASKLKTIEDLRELVKAQDNEALTLHTPNGTNVKGIILIDRHGAPHVYYFSSEKMFEVAVVLDDSTSKRTPDYCVQLREKSVAIIGLGSVGSKVAESLCRVGLGKFYLVDEDLFLVGNLERHALDWRNIGFHKVEAVAQKLRYISPLTNIETLNVNLTGQESNVSVNQAMVKISECDLIVDATANGQVFNLLASVALDSKKPLLWAEVFAGGIGGLIARSRPGQDPSPQMMRRAYHQYTVETPNFDRYTVPAPYTFETNDGGVYIASDADVSVIASHLTRLIADTAVNSDESMFPYSMYLIGLSNGWIFSQPFDTKPIRTDHLLQEEEPSAVIDDETRFDNAAFLLRLVERIDD